MQQVRTGPLGGPIGVLVKPASADCNLRCEYCFYYGRETDPYTGEQKRRVMSHETLERFLSEFLPMAGPQPSFGWQGGEPTLAGLPFFEDVVELQRTLKDRGQTVSNALQTNCWVIDDTWAQFLREHRFLVGASIDGPLDLNDRYRVTAGGNGTFERIMRNINTMRQRDVAVNILAVVNQLTARHPDRIWEFFTGEGFDWLQFIPVVERDPRSGKPTAFSVKPAQFGDFLVRIFDLWWNDGNPRVSVRLFDEVLAAVMGQGANMCQLHPSCGGYVVVEYNGDVYPCDFFVEKRWHLGNVTEQPLAEIVHGERNREFIGVKPRAAKKCMKCPWQGICQNGCPHYRSLGDGKLLALDYLCPAYERFYKHAVPILAKAVRRPGPAPAVR